MVTSGASVTVAAAQVVEGMLTPLLAAAEVVGTWIVVVAIGISAAQAGTVGAGVVGGARVAVVARLVGWNVLTTTFIVTAIRGAGVVVAACQLAGVDALAQVAVVPRGADAAIIARSTV